MAEITLFKSQQETLLEMLAQLQGMVPDAYIGDDGILNIIFTIEAGQFENAFLANQLVFQDMFVQTASLQGLIQHGIQVGLELKEGTYASGNVTFEGDGGTYIPISTEVGYDPGGGVDLVYFSTTIDGSIPNPGTPTAPTVATAPTGVLTGTYEYRVTFVTAAGETLTGPDSAAVVPAAQKVQLTAIPTGGAGTISRKIYRDKNGAGDYRLVATIADNTTTTYLDNISDATVLTQNSMPTVDTAHRITLAAQAEETGIDGNVIGNTITELVNAPASLTGIVSSSAFTGGTDLEDTDSFRNRLQQYMRSPLTGSPSDLKVWSESIAGVESASVFTNDNLGVATNGHATVRISGPDGSIPDAGVIADVLAYLNSKDLANITLHVAAFNAVVLNVTVDVTTAGSYTMSDISPVVQQAIAEYINNLAVGETAYISGIIAAVKPVAGVADVTVSLPSANQPSTAADKFVPGTITVV